MKRRLVDDDGTPQHSDAAQEISLGESSYEDDDFDEEDLDADSKEEDEEDIEIEEEGKKEGSKEDDGGYTELDEATESQYLTWKKNVPLLYDLVITHHLEVPSLTVSWLPGRVESLEPDKRDTVDLQLLIGTQAPPKEQNFVMTATVKVPHESVRPETLPEAVFPDNKGESVIEYGQYRIVPEGIHVHLKIPHNGDVNRARHMPQDKDIIATKSSLSEITVFRISKLRGSKAEGTSYSILSGRPHAVLSGHTEEGYGLSWNPVREGRLLSGSYDALACVWDVAVAANSEAPQQSESPLSQLPLHTFRAHKGPIEDAAWHPKHGDLFATVGDDKLLAIWDCRESAKPPISVVDAHTMDVHSVSFNNKSCEYLLATGSADKTVALWDLRCVKSPWHVLKGHTDEVLPVCWSPFHNGILASGSKDKYMCSKIILWDLARIGKAQTQEEATNGPPELLFVHGGHVHDVVDISWSLSEPWLLASVDSGHSLQTWKPSKSSYSE